jgi:hypothetical protein
LHLALSTKNDVVEKNVKTTHFSERKKKRRPQPLRGTRNFNEIRKYLIDFNQILIDFQ